MFTRERHTTYSIAEAARALDVPPAAVWDAIARGMIHTVMFGKAIRVPADEVTRMLVNSARHAEDQRPRR
jgi:excisionase family DNA binding protein